MRLVAVSSFGLLVFRHPLADVSAKAAAPIGAAFTLLALVTGSLWGKPGWGTYWVWDARLTSVLVLFFLYLGLIALRSSIEDETLAGADGRAGLIGVVMLPIIKYSVNGGRPCISRRPASGSTVDPSLRWPLLVMAPRYPLFLAMHSRPCATRVLRRRVKTLMLTEVERSRPRPKPRPRSSAVDLGPNAVFVWAAYTALPSCLQRCCCGWPSTACVSNAARCLEARAWRRRSTRRGNCGASMQKRDLGHHRPPSPPHIGPADARCCWRRPSSSSPRVDVRLRPAQGRSFETAVRSVGRTGATAGSCRRSTDWSGNGGQPVPGIDANAFKTGGVSVVNFWASWCVPCVQEHPLLVQLAERTT